MNDFAPIFSEAMLHFREGRYDDAGSLLERILNDDPQHKDALEALGVVRRKQERSDDAIGLFKRLVQLDPDHVMAHGNLSQIYMEQGRIQEAEAEQAIARRLSWKKELKERKDARPIFEIEAQIERFKKIIELAPADVLGYFSLGGVYADAEHWPEAVQTYQKAVEVDPNHSSSYLGLGVALQALGKCEEARQIFERGIPISEKNGDMIPFKKMSARLRELQQGKS